MAVLYFPFNEKGQRVDFNGNREECCWSHKLNKNDIADMYTKLYSVYIELYSENKKLKEQLSEKTEALKTAADNYKELRATKNKLIRTEIEDVVDQIIKEKLSLETHSEMYAGNYMSIDYAGTTLGETVCLQHYSDD